MIPPIKAAVTARINNQPVHLIGFDIERHVDYVMSEGPRLSPHWELVDDQGHYHAYSTDPDRGKSLADKYPTLTHSSEHVPCDGACGSVCEGYSVDRFACRICEQPIKPGLIHGAYASAVPGLYEWKLDVANAPEILPVGQEVSVRLSSGHFGVAMVANRSMVDSSYWITELQGNGPLGYRAGKSSESTEQPADESADEPG